MIDLSFFLGRSYFGSYELQHYLVFYEKKEFLSHKNL